MSMRPQLVLLLGAAKLYGRPQEVGRKHAHDPNPNRLLPPSTGWNSSPHLKPRHREWEMWALGCPEWSGTVGF